MIKREDDGIWVELNETVAVHHDEVFALLTTPEGLSRWFPVAARVDLRPGGTITLGWNADFTRTTTIAILDYDPEGKVVWDWQAGHPTRARVYAAVCGRDGYTAAPGQQENSWRFPIIHLPMHE